MATEQSNQPQEVEIDGATLSVAELHHQIGQLAAGSSVRLRGFSSDLAGLGAGLNRSIDLQIEGSVGPFAFLLGQKLRAEITQNVSNACGHSLHSGSVLIRGDCGSYLACYAVGGLVTAYGKAGDYAAYGLSGGEVVIRSRCAVGAGTGMTSGTLVIGNGSGDKLGNGMTGGTIFVRGLIGSLGDGVQQVPVKDADTLRLGLLLARAGLKTQLAEFKAFRSSRTSKGISTA